MENLNYDLVSDCCGCAVGFETGEGSDRIGICTDCQEWCGVVEDEAMVKALEDNDMTMEEYNELPDYIPGLDDGEGWDPIMGDAENHIETDDQWLDDFYGEEDFA